MATTVLVVDPDIHSLKRVNELLLPQGYAVCNMMNWDMQRYQFFGIPSAILLGFQPSCTATQDLCGKMRRFAASTPIIVLGPNIEADDKVTLFEKGADDYVVQPFDSSEMLARLRSAVRRFNRTRENL